MFRLISKLLRYIKPLSNQQDETNITIRTIIITIIFLYEVCSHSFRAVEHLSKCFPPFSPLSSGLSCFLRRVCSLESSGPPSSLLCQQHRRFFWRKRKNPYSVVHPATVRPAYGVPKVNDLLPPKQQYQKVVFFKKHEGNVFAN